MRIIPLRHSGTGIGDHGLKGSEENRREQVLIGYLRLKPTPHRRYGPATAHVATSLFWEGFRVLRLMLECELESSRTNLFFRGWRTDVFLAAIPNIIPAFEFLKSRNRSLINDAVKPVQPYQVYNENHTSKKSLAILPNTHPRGPRGTRLTCTCCAMTIRIPNGYRIWVCQACC
jgi:hypothetical protein